MSIQFINWGSRSLNNAWYRIAILVKLSRNYLPHYKSQPKHESNQRTLYQSTLFPSPFDELLLYNIVII